MYMYKNMKDCRIGILNRYKTANIFAIFFHFLCYISHLTDLKRLRTNRINLVINSTIVAYKT